MEKRKVRAGSIVSNHAVLAAVVKARRQGQHRLDTCAELRISRATYYRCVEEIDRRTAAHKDEAERN